MASTARKAPPPQPSRRVPRQLRSKQTLEAILRVAQEILEKDGPNAFHMTRLARDVGMSIGTVYEYFPDKAAVVSALIDRAAGEEAGAVMARLAEGHGTIHATFRAAIATVFDVYRRHHALVLALRALAADAWDIGNRPTERFIQDAMEQQLEPLLRGRPDITPRMAAFIVFHTVESLSSRMLDHRDPTWTDDQCIDEITRVVLRYLGVPDVG